MWTSIYDEVVKHFSQTDYSIPCLEKGEPMDQESSGCLANASFGARPKFYFKPWSWTLICRYLRASKWKPVTAINRIEITLKWRREYGLYDIPDSKLGWTRSTLLFWCALPMFIHYGFPSCHRETAYLRLQRQREASLLQPTPFVKFSLSSGC